MNILSSWSLSTWLQSRKLWALFGSCPRTNFFKKINFWRWINKNFTSYNSSCFRAFTRRKKWDSGRWNGFKLHPFYQKKWRRLQTNLKNYRKAHLIRRISSGWVQSRNHYYSRNSRSSHLHRISLSKTRRHRPIRPCNWRFNLHYKIQKSRIIWC